MLGAVDTVEIYGLWRMVTPCSLGAERP